MAFESRFIETDGRLITDVLRELNQALIAHGVEPDESLFSNMSGLDGTSFVFPANYRWIVCHVVRGGSEGYYVHLAVVVDEQRENLVTPVRSYRLIGLAKSFDVDIAREIAKETSELLDI